MSWWNVSHCLLLMSPSFVGKKSLRELRCAFSMTHCTMPSTGQQQIWLLPMRSSPLFRVSSEFAVIFKLLYSRTDKDCFFYFCINDPGNLHCLADVENIHSCLHKNLSLWTWFYREVCGSTSGSLSYLLLPLLWNKLLLMRSLCHGILSTWALKLKSQILHWCSWCMLSSRGFIFSYASFYVHNLSVGFNSKLSPMWRVAIFRLNCKESVIGCQSSHLYSFCSAVHLFIHTCSNVDAWKNILQVLSSFAQVQVFF